MARKPASKELEPIAETQESVDEPDITRASAGGDQSISQTDAVKGALDSGYELPGEATDYIRDQFGMEVSKAYFSAIKSKLKAQGGKTKKRSVGRPSAASVRQNEASSTSQPSSRQKSAGGDDELLKALEVMKPLIDALGAEKVRRIVDLLD
jgi:hypothetical protein